jgi:retron-type reverse transcriptase
MFTRELKTHVLMPLATGLAQLDWTVWDIQQHLERRLPAALAKSTRALAEDLIRAFPASVAPDVVHITQHLLHSAAASGLRRYAKRTGAQTHLTTEPPKFRPAPAFAPFGLPSLASPADLADWLALSPAQLSRFSDCLGLSARAGGPFAPHYRHHMHLKSDGQLRLLEEPKPVLKRLQRRILQDMLNLVPPHAAAYGFCPGKNAVMAAARHVGEAMVVSFDLSGFFPSIAQNRVYALYRRMGYPSAVAKHLTGLSTAITPPQILATPDLAARDALSSRHLPQGAPTSPALANLVAYSLDVRLEGLARRIGAIYTRYADDLSFSGDLAIAPALRRAVPDIVRDCGFALNPAKTRMQPAHARQMVTGIVVNQHVNLPRQDYDLLKATIHHLRRTDDPRRADATFLAQLAGRIGWVEQVNPVKGARLRDGLADALNAPE